MRYVLFLLLSSGFAFAQQPPAPNTPSIYEAPPPAESHPDNGQNGDAAEPPPFAEPAPKTGKSPYENPQNIPEPADEKNADPGDLTSSFVVKGIELEANTPEETYEFWGTGPLLAPAGDVPDLGHIIWQPYFFANEYTGSYDKHWEASSYPLFTNLQPLVLIRVGVFPYGEFEFVPTLNYNHTKGASKWAWGDMPIAASVLFLEDEAWYHPNLKLRITANLPIGKFDRLKASKLETDIGGTGSWEPGAGLIYYHEQHIYKHHFLTIYGFLTYLYETRVHVKGLNAYGGGPGTRGTVYPGNKWEAILSFEYSLTQNWVLALDNVYLHTNRTKFHGTTVDPVGLPSSEQFSMAPAIEYNFSENFGIIAGAWFTVLGRNTDRFASGVVSLYIVK